MEAAMASENVHIPYDEPVMEYHRVISQLVAKYFRNTGKILDYGCGLGHVTSLVSQLLPEADLYAADIDPVCLDITSRRADGVHLIQLREDNEFEGVGTRYDICIMSHVLEHMKDPYGTLLSVIGIVRPGGHVIVAVPNIVRPDTIMDSLRRRHYANRGHVCAWDRSHWINFLEEICNLHVVEYAADTCPFFLRRFGHLALVKWFERKVVHILPWLSQSHIAVIQKGMGE